jgi:Predicted nucleotide-binding protein containing TIR-like domain
LTRSHGHLFVPYQLPVAIPADINARQVPVRELKAQWDEARLIAIRRAGAVLTIGGMFGTYQGGLTASLAGRKLAHIASFGGASEKLLSARIQAVEMAGGNEDLSGLMTLNNGWNPHVMNAALDLIGVGRLLRLVVVHGRSDDRGKLAEWLGKHHNVHPTIMQEESGAGGAITLAEKFEGLALGADAAIALATPDDTGGFGKEHKKARARQNVWLEVGWFWGRLGRDKLLVLCKKTPNGQKPLEIPSDLHGIEYLEYEQSPVEVGHGISAFVQRVQKNL